MTGPAQQGIAKDRPVTFDEVSVALSNWYGGDVVLTELRWGSRFTDAARQAEQHRLGRLVTSELAAKAVVRPDGYVAWTSDDPDAEHDVCDLLPVVRFHGVAVRRATT